MNDEPEWHSRWLATHEAMVACFRERRFADAVDLMEKARHRALEMNSVEEAASYCGLLSSCLAIVDRYGDAFEASEQAELLAPDEPHYTVRSADLLLNYLGDPQHALAKIVDLLHRLPQDDPSRYSALSLLGQTKLALGEPDSALALFRQITSPEMMTRLRRAEYAGVYDLGLVHALIKQGLALVECREYVLAVRDVAEANGSTFVVEDLDRLLAKISSPA